MADREELLRLAETIEAKALGAAKAAVRNEPWADQYRTARMRYAADCAAVAASLRARAQDPLRAHGGGE